MPERRLALLVRLAALVPAYLVTLALAALLFPPAAPPGASPEPGPLPPLATALVAAATHVVVVAFVILRSRASAPRLALTLPLAYYGCTTLLAQVETGFFLLGRTVSPEALLDLFLMGLPPAWVFVPLSVWLVAPLRPRDPAPLAPSRMPVAQWAWKLAVLSAAYVALYLTAGYYVAWRNPELRAFYGGPDPAGFFAMLRAILDTMPWIFPLQVARGLLWITFVLPVVRGSRPGAWPNALAAASLLAFPMNAGLLFPNPFMPAVSVRMSHLVETTSSSFAFGLLVAWLLHRRHGSWRDLLGAAPASTENGGAVELR